MNVTHINAIWYPGTTVGEMKRTVVHHINRLWSSLKNKMLTEFVNEY